MTVGNVVAIGQQNIKRLLAYSTIAHAGYLLVGVAAISQAGTGDTAFGPSSLLFYIGAYTVTNLAAFAAVIAVSNKTDSDMIEDFAGMARRAPYLAAALTLAMVALIGIPPSGIFMAKLYVFSAAVHSDLAWLAVVGVVNSVISAYYYLKVVRTMYVTPPTSEEKVPSSHAFRLGLAAAALAVVGLGIYPTPLLEVAEAAVVSLLQAANGIAGTP